MKMLSAKTKEAAMKYLKMHFGQRPHDMGHEGRHRSYGLFEQQALSKCGEMPLELIKALHAILCNEKTKEEALKDLTMYFFEYRKT